MTKSQLRAASEMEAALFRLDYEPSETTEAELAADDAEFAPAMMDGSAPEAKFGSEAPEIITASGAGKIPNTPQAT